MATMTEGRPGKTASIEAVSQTQAANLPLDRVKQAEAAALRSVTSAASIVQRYSELPDTLSGNFGPVLPLSNSLSNSPAHAQPFGNRGDFVADSFLSLAMDFQSAGYVQAIGEELVSAPKLF